MGEEIVENEEISEEIVEDVNDEVVDANEDYVDEGGDQASEAEVSARMQGWVPQEEFRGDPDLWKSAEAFNEYGEKHAAVLKERGKKAAEDNKKLSSDISALRAIMATMTKNQKKQVDLAVDDAVRQALTKRDEAIEVGDVDAVHEQDKEIERLKAEARDDDTPVETEDFLQWKQDNPWYNSNVDMSADADIIGEQLIKTGRYKTDNALFAAVLRKVKGMYPDEFDETPKINPRKTKQSAVSTPKKTPTSKPKGKTWSDIPAEDRRQFEQQQAQIGEAYTREDFVQGYFEE